MTTTAGAPRVPDRPAAPAASPPRSGAEDGAPVDPSLAEARPGAADSSGDTGSVLVDRALAAMVRRNDARVARVDPRPARSPLRERPWFARFRAGLSDYREEWHRFDDGGGLLPLIDDLLEGYQGHIGAWWRAGPLVSAGRPVPGLGEAFPRTTAALQEIPGLRSAMWSVMGPQAGLPEHVGTNRGADRFLFSVDGGPDAQLWIDGEHLRIDDGEGYLFDDTFPHRSWNPGPGARVLLLGDIDRPLPHPHDWVNRAVQRTHHLAIPRYRRTPRRAAELFEALNSSAAGSPGAGPTRTPRGR